MRILLCLLALLPVLSFAQTISPTNPDVFRLRLEDPRVTATPSGGSTALNALLVNPTSSTLTITGASTPMAGQTILQRYVKDKSGLIQLTPVTRLLLPPHSETVLAPGALELQLVGLTTELQAGLELPLTIKFAEGTQRVVRIRVE